MRPNLLKQNTIHKRTQNQISPKPCPHLFLILRERFEIAKTEANLPIFKNSIRYFKLNYID
ncbi:hypothetical protein EHQ24_01470 [Leptospira noumeaensis]|uniref:Uncharacterized protein n=1 Tax=Leptospira noumeaensis TaxID=2484964 RepID=A0A4R9IHF6_9LEPT|nr:hypothetical protein [Leptospira noumeaensis]TGK87908.1 hypothetical protein EHQ24_01470 [Leptospira noumeaensis]